MWHQTSKEWEFGIGDGLKDLGGRESLVCVLPENWVEGY